MKRNGVSKGLVISDSELKSSIGSLRECCELFADCSNVSVVGGISPFIQFEDQLALLENYLAVRMACGIKIYSGHKPIYLINPVLEPVYKLAKRHSVPVLFHSGWNNVEYSAPEIILQAAQAHPDTSFVCCHCCYPKLMKCFSTLAECKNVFFEISSIADDSAVAFKLKPVLENAIHEMPNRFIFGSDFASCDQSAHIEFCNTLALSNNEKELLFSSNAERVYCIKADV